METGVPTGTRSIRTCRSASAARRQPAEAAVPIVEGASVPWIAIRLPPVQPGGVFGWWPLSARMQQP